MCRSLNLLSFQLFTLLVIACADPPADESGQSVDSGSDLIIDTADADSVDAADVEVRRTDTADDAIEPDLAGPDAEPPRGEPYTTTPTSCIDQNWCYDNNRPTSRRVLDVWSGGDGQVWAVGRAGTLLSYNEGEYEAVVVETRRNLNAIHGSSPDNVWVVGSGGFALHFDGVGWETTNVGLNVHLNDVWVANRTNAWAVTYDGLALHWNGVEWAVENTGVSSALLTVTGSSMDDIWAAGSDGVVLHHDGERWSTVSSQAGLEWRSLTSVGTEQVWVVGGEGQVRLINGESETNFQLDTAELWGGWAESVERAWVTSSAGEVGIYDGQSWAIQSLTDEPISGIWGQGGEYWAVGGFARLFRSQDGFNWTTINEPVTTDSILTMDALGDDVAWAATDDALLQWHEDGWVVAHEFTSPLRRYDLTVLPNASGSEVWIGSDAGFVGRWDGVSYDTEFRTPYGERDLFHIDGTSTSDVWATPLTGIWHYDGEEWTQPELPQGAGRHLTRVYAFAEDLVVALSQTHVLVFDGVEWVALDIPNVLAAWARSPDDIFVLTDTYAARWNGLQLFDLGLRGDEWTDIWVRSDDDIWISYAQGLLVHWDGTEWISSSVGYNVQTHLSVGDQSAWAYSDFGLIYRYID